MSWPAQTSTSARPSSWAKSSSTRWGCRAAPRPRPAPGPPAPTCWRTSPRKGMPLARTIVDWRQLTKLMGTYTDALPAYINQRTGRVHTTYSPAFGADRAALAPTIRTCRTSRCAPRTAARSAPPSSPPPGKILISADYSPDRIARPRPYRRYPGAEGRVRGRPRHPRHDGVRNVRRAGRGHAVRCAPPRQGDQFRHHLRHFGLRPRQPAGHRALARPAITSRPISSASPASRTTWTSSAAG